MHSWHEGVGGWKEHDLHRSRRSQVELSPLGAGNLATPSTFAFLILLEGLQGSAAWRGLIILLAVSTQGFSELLFRLIIDNANVIINI